MEYDDFIKLSAVVVTEPKVIVIAESHLNQDGLRTLAEFCDVSELYPSERRGVSDAELLAEIAGRHCYQSYGSRGAKRSNYDYIKSTQDRDTPHRSILYHPKMTFLIGNISLHVANELIRNYVGADRTQEGSPSCVSSRYTFFGGVYKQYPGGTSINHLCNKNFDEYKYEVVRRFRTAGGNPKGMERKRILEECARMLNRYAATSFLWTTNPIALAGLIREREHECADLEFIQLAKMLKSICVERWPALFPCFLFDS